MNIKDAKSALDKVIKKARVHLYKPIQIAEILYRDRVLGDIKLDELEYRIKSRSWRDEICMRFLGRISTSSMRYQDDLFNENATPPSVLFVLGKANKKKMGIIEAYIYQHVAKKHKQITDGLVYCENSNRNKFKLLDFLNMFWNEPGLRRSIDKIYEIVVYALFSVLICELDVSVEISMNPKEIDLLREFEDFAKKVLGIDLARPRKIVSAKLNRVGVTNAADRGLDMWSNYGPVIQVKHLSLNEELAEDIVFSITSDRIVIVCKDSERKVIMSLLNQIGWKSRIQSIITENELIDWYEKALRGGFGPRLGVKLLTALCEEMKGEFRMIGSTAFNDFMSKRSYSKLSDKLWQVTNG